MPLWSTAALVSWLQSDGLVLVAVVGYHGIWLCRTTPAAPTTLDCVAADARPSPRVTGRSVLLCRESAQLILEGQDGKWKAIGAHSFSTRAVSSLDDQYVPLGCDASGGRVTFERMYKNTPEQLVWHESTGQITKRSLPPAPGDLVPWDANVRAVGGDYDWNAATLKIFGRTFDGCTDKAIVSANRRTVACERRYDRDQYAFVVWRL